jgi:predicted DNA repair protein MutK
MRFLSVAGTVAMFLVEGSIITLSSDFFEHLRRIAPLWGTSV